jgi:glutathione S-transferase
VITLYGTRSSPFTEKVARGLAFKKLPFTHVEPASPEDYRRWNPSTGTLPVIDLDGERIHDSTAILLRIDERFPEPPLLASDSRTAAHQLRLVRWIDETFFWYWNRWMRRAGEAPFAGPFISLEGESLADAEHRLRHAAPPRPPGWGARRWAAALARRRAESERESDEERLLHEACQRVDDLSGLLHSRPFFFAERLSIADIAAFAMLRSLAEDAIPGSRAYLERCAPIRDFMARVEGETSAGAH